MRLVFVHGRSQEGKNPQALRASWCEALSKGLEKSGLKLSQDAEIEMPYYGDLLAELIEQLRNAAPPDVGFKGSTALDRVDSVRDEILRELLGDEMQLSPEKPGVPKGWQNSGIALGLARMADASPYGERLLRRFTEDVATYLTVEPVGLAIDGIVEEAIGTQPCVVVAHSLGSVIAYRVLRRMGRRANVARLVTVGSPLGLATIRRRLIPPELGHPEGVRSWLNAFDPTDVVSLFPLDQKRWPINPEIENFDGVHNHTDNHHSIDGYLCDETLARAVFCAMSVAE